MSRQAWAALLVAVAATVAHPGAAAAAVPGVSQEEFESDLFSGLSGYVGYAGNQTLAADGSIGGGRGRFTVTGLIEPDGTSDLAVVTADGLRTQQLCRLESDADSGATLELCVDRMARAGQDVAGQPWFPAAGSPFETLTVMRLGERVMAGITADIAGLRSPRVELSTGGDGATLTQSVRAISGGTTLEYVIASAESGWSVVATRNGAETGRLTLAPAAAAVGTAYPAGEALAPRFAVWANLDRVATSLDRGLARRGAVPTTPVRVPTADAPDAIYAVCVRTAGGRPGYVVMGTQPGSPYHWRRTSGTRTPDVTAYRNPSDGQLPGCAAVRGKAGPRVIVR